MTFSISGCFFYFCGMNNFFPLLLCVLLISACGQNPKKQTAESSVDPKNLISCEGVGEVKLSYSYADLEDKFGTGALTEHENTVSGKYTSIWEGEPRRLDIYWKEAEPPFTQIKYIEVNEVSSPYVTEKGLNVGISLRDVVKINGNMPITFVNFYAADNSGDIISFNGGDIEKELPCISGHIEMYNKRNVQEDELQRLREKKEIESYEAILERIDSALGSIRVMNK